MTKDEMKDRISMALKDPVLQQGFEIICKENAELKAFRQDCVKLTEDNIVMARQRAETARKLIVAKAIITSLIDDLEIIDGEQTRELKAVKEAEQFLKEV